MDFEKNYREFLNEDKSQFAFVGWEVQVEEDYLGWNEASFSLADCSRRITLSFPLHREDWVKASRKKLAQLKKVLTEFEEAFEEGVIKVEEARKRNEKEEKDDKRTILEKLRKE